MEQPLISVIIPTYNYAHFIKYAVESVFHQDYPSEKIEIVIVDDGSQDDTATVIAQLQDHRIRYVYQENQGKAAATSHAVELARGKYIFNLDADDYYLPHKISTTVAIFEQYPNIVHIGNPALIIKEEEKTEKIEPIPNWMKEKELNGLELNRFFLENNMLFGGGSTYAARANVLKRMPIPKEVDMYIDEYLIFATLLYGNSYFFAKPLSVWRVHGKNYSGKVRTKEAVAKRHQRLLQSSIGTLHQLKKMEGIPSGLIDLYAFKHQIRVISHKEKEGKKTWNDILQFWRYYRFENKQSAKVLKQYSVRNRLIPQSLIKILKKIKYLHDGFTSF
ncbi:MAG: glycosyltransferase family 2 protein [Saprospiraceae bacterium]|nr:glycosyltransferase family 2 protein [Saprospiraceae bacterium]